jgi:hypothetical protein
MSSLLLSSRSRLPNQPSFQLKLPSPDIDLPLAMYSQIIALILDIPVNPPQERTDHQGRKSTTRNVIEGLHVLFTLYSEFKNSAHFNALDRDEEVAPPSNTQEMVV